MGSKQATTGTASGRSYLWIPRPRLFSQQTTPLQPNWRPFVRVLEVWCWAECIPPSRQAPEALAEMGLNPHTSLMCCWSHSTGPLWLDLTQAFNLAGHLPHCSSSQLSFESLPKGDSGPPQSTRTQRNTHDPLKGGWPGLHFTVPPKLVYMRLRWPQGP